MRKNETKTGNFAAGKRPITLVLPEKLIKKVCVLAAHEGTGRRSYVFERLILKGLEAEAQEATNPTGNAVSA